MNIQNYKSKLERGQLLTQREISNLTETAISILIQESNVVQVSGQQYVIGDIHGQFYDFKNMMQNIIPAVGEKNYVFLGDYVDRGYHSIETICLLLSYKCLYPGKIVMIRGNHETSSLTKIYGFYDEVGKKYGNYEPWKNLTEAFQYLPLAAIVNNKLLCLHGGLSPNLPFIDDMSLIQRVRQIPQSGSMSDIVWSDPDNSLQNWAISNRGAGYLFPHKAVTQFLFINNLQCIARAHQLVEQGYTYNFSDKSLVTVWSAPNYCYRCGNKASIMKSSQQGEPEFIMFDPSTQNQKNISYQYLLPYFL